MLSATSNLFSAYCRWPKLATDHSYSFFFWKKVGSTLSWDISTWRAVRELCSSFVSLPTST
eukprot:4578847-Pyramimonas_sp.AAC.1